MLPRYWLILVSWLTWFSVFEEIQFRGVRVKAFIFIFKMRNKIFCQFLIVSKLIFGIDFSDSLSLEKRY